MSLLSDSEMAAIQSIAQLGMKTSVSIFHGARTQTANGQAWAYPTTADLTVNGWLYEMTGAAAKLGVIDGGTAISEMFRLTLPVGTDCRIGDKVVISGLSFYVQHTNEGDTYPAWLICFLRRQS